MHLYFKLCSYTVFRKSIKIYVTKKLKNILTICIVDLWLADVITTCIQPIHYIRLRSTELVVYID